MTGKFKHGDDMGVNIEKAAAVMNTPEYKERISYYKGIITAMEPG